MISETDFRARPRRPVVPINRSKPVGSKEAPDAQEEQPTHGPRSLNLAGGVGESHSPIIITPRQPSQSEFPLFLIKGDDANVSWLLGLLGASGWMTRKQILNAAGRPSNAYGERWVRALAAAAGPQIVKGQKGFNLMQNCTLEELNAAANQRRAQARKELEYYIAMKKEVHRRVSGK